MQETIRGPILEVRVQLGVLSICRFCDLHNHENDMLYFQQHLSFGIDFLERLSKKSLIDLVFMALMHGKRPLGQPVQFGSRYWLQLEIKRK